MKTLLLTGACGFVGSHIVEEALRYENMQVVALDRLAYAGRLDRLAHLRGPRLRFVFHDFSQAFSTPLLDEIGQVDYIIHNGAESHVARSFQNPGAFVQSNVLGTLNVLQAARVLKPVKMVYVSTDEVMGSSTGKPFQEGDPLNPTNPYAATKAAGEFLAHSYFRCFDVPVVISRTMNIFGERQHPEKFIPRVIGQMLRGEQVKVFGRFEVLPSHMENFQPVEVKVWYPCSRHWLHARVQANALMFLLQHGEPGQKYHIDGVEKNNKEIVELIENTLGLKVPWVWADPAGPAYDLSYSLDGSLLRALGWTPPRDFEKSFRDTVLWTAQHPEYLEE